MASNCESNQNLRCQDKSAKTGLCTVCSKSTGPNGIACNNCKELRYCSRACLEDDQLSHATYCGGSAEPVPQVNERNIRNDEAVVTVDSETYAAALQQARRVRERRRRINREPTNLLSSFAEMSLSTDHRLHQHAVRILKAKRRLAF